ncbi:MAG: immunoglobulin domain-containing protein [Verrucomicrobia bacterium]|nr:immunoglobulin domain-containing protein [Verrucomicrobiota bacterium]
MVAATSMNRSTHRSLGWLLLAVLALGSLWSLRPPRSAPEPAGPPPAPAPTLVSTPARTTNAPANAEAGWNGWRAQLPAAQPAIQDVTEWPANRAEAFEKFRAWQAQYRAEAGNAGLEAEGIALAKARRVAMARWIERDPEFALMQALSPDARRGLPAAVLAELEARVDGRGHYFVMVRCGENVRADQQFLRRAQIGGQTWSAFVYGRRYHQTTKYDLPLHGVALDGMLALHESPVRQLDPLEAQDRGLDGQAIHLETGGPVRLAMSAQDAFAIEAGLKQREAGQSPYTRAILGSVPPPPDVLAFPPSPGWTLGVKRFLIVRVDFSDDPGGPFERNTGQIITTNTMNSIMTDVNRFYLENSQGQTSIQTFHVPAVLRMPQTKATYDAGTPDTLRTDMLAAALSFDQANGNTGQYNPATYDLDTVVFSDMNGANWQFGGLAGVGSKRMWVNAEFSLRILSHELGHNYGLLHANRWDVTGTDPIDPAGTHNEYGDEYDMMGGNSGIGGNRPIHFSEWFKAYLGWLNTSQWRTAPTGGVYRLFRHDHTNASGIRGITVGQASDRAYWLGFRRDLTNYAANSFGATNFLANGVEFRWGMQPPGLTSDMTIGSRLLNFAPATANFTRHPLPIGQTFTDPAFNLSITPLSVGGTSPNEFIDLNITYSTPPVTITQNPTNLTVLEGNTASFSVTVTGGGPISYQWTFNSVNIPGATASNLTLTAVTTNQAGTYLARVTNPGGTVNSQPAALTVIPVGPFTNGSFELPVLASTITATNGSTVVTGWTIGGINPVGLIRGQLLGQVALDGAQWIGFNGNDLTPGDSIAQTFKTTPGETYSVSFNVVQLGAAGNTMSVRGTATSSSGLVLGTLNAVAPVSGWSAPQKFSFVATGPTSTLTFLDTSLSTSGVDVFLDNVVVKQLGPTPAGLLAHWRFDEVPGATNSVDSLGNFDGINSPAGTTFVPGGRAGNALSLTRTQNGFVDMGNVLSLTSGVYSVVAWSKLAPGDVQDNQVIAAKHTSGSRNGYFLLVNTTGGVLTQGKASLVTGGSGAASPTTGETPISTSSVNDGDWHQIVAVHDVVAGTKKIYVDGSPVEDTKAVQIVTPNTTAPFLIGGTFNGTANVGLFDGLLDDIQIYNRALNDTEIDILFQFPGQEITAAPIIAVPPQTIAAVAGSNVTFTVTAYGTVAGTGPLTYQWLRSGTNLPGATSATLSLPNVQAASAGDYSVRVSNTAGSTTSAVAVLTVITFAPVAHWKFDEAPGATVAVDSRGSFNGTNSPTGSGFVTGGRSGNAMSLDIAANGFVNFGNNLMMGGSDFTVSAWIKTPPGDSTVSPNFLSKHISGFGNGYILSYNHSVLANGPSKAFFYAGTRTIFAGGFSIVDVPVSTTSVNDGSWHLLVGVYQASGSTTIYVDGAPVEGSILSSPVAANAAPFLVGGVTSGSTPTGTYSGLVDDVQIYNRALLDGEIDFIFQNPGQPIIGAPIVTGRPQNASVVLGQTATFSVTNSGIAPFTYQWRLNGANLTGATSPTLTLNNVQTNQAGDYSVRIDNGLGFTLSSNATLTVLVPAFVAAAPTNLTLLTGSTAAFTVTAGGTPPFAYQWRFNGADLPGANLPSLVLANAQFTNAGAYSVLVANSYGSSISSNATLTVNSPPIITAQPAGRVASVAAPATFSVGIAGTPPFGYQWRFNGSNIAGATAASHTISGVVGAHAGIYSVVVTNTYGSITSAGAPLTVIPLRVFSPWGVVAGGAGADAANGVAVDASGNAFVVGHFTGTAMFGATQLTNAGARDGFLAKISPSGQTLWLRAIGGAGFDAVNAVAVDTGGNCYIVGNYEGIANFGSVALTNSSASSFSDVFIAKFDTGGATVWARSLGVAAFSDLGSAVALDGAGNVFVAGQSTFPSFSGVALTNHGRIFVAKYDNSGNPQWARKAGGGSTGQSDTATALAADAAGNVYLAGVFASAAANFDGSLALANEGGLDAFLARFDGTGGLQWVRQLGGAQESRANGLAVDAGGNAYIVGEFTGTMQLPGTSLSTALSDQNLFIARFSAAGAVDWARQAGGPLQDSARAVTVRGTNVFIAGYFSGAAVFGPDTLVSVASTFDAVLARLDTNGTFAFAQQAGGSDLGGDFGLGVAVDANGSAVLVGSFNGAGALGSTNATSTGGEDIFVTRFNAFAGDAAPTLGLLPMGGQLRLSWPLGSSSYILQVAPDLRAQSWADFLGVLGVENSELAMTNQVPVTNRFFRLRKP